MAYQHDFINKIAPIVQKYVQQYGYGVPSAIISQACLESAYGTSNKAKHHNYFGLKYRPNRCSASNGTFVDDSKEQNEDGSYTNISDQWFQFATMDAGVQGYFQFISVSYYDEAKKETDPEKYLKALKAAGYATSKTYVPNNMAVIERYSLTKYDPAKKEKKVSKVGKPKVTRKISNPHNFNIGRGGNSIKYIVMHYTGVPTDTAAANATYFAREKLITSAHYFVDSADIYQSVEDSNTAWHCGKNYGKNNLFGKCTNQNSIGIEMCSNHGVITAKTLTNAANLVKYLMAEYKVPVENVVRHYDVCTKSCPGWTGWLPPDESKWLAFKKQLGDTPVVKIKQTVKKESKSAVPFIVKVTISDLNIRTGPGTTYNTTGKFTGKGKFTIVEVSKDGEWGKLKSGAGWIYIRNSQWTQRV